MMMTNCVLLAKVGLSVIHGPNNSDAPECARFVPIWFLNQPPAAKMLPPKPRQKPGFW